MWSSFEIFTLIFNLSIYFALIFLAQNSSVLFSVLTLILVACFFSIYIISFSSFFIGLLYLAIYVGAVTVFILFVVMMTDLSFSNTTTAYGNLSPLYTAFIPFNFVINNFFIFSISYFFTKLFEQLLFFTNETSTSFGLFNILLQKGDSQTLELSFTLLQNNMAPFIILGLIILITLIGSIFIITQNTKPNLHNLSLLVFNKNYVQPNLSLKSQDMDLQLLAESKDSIKLNSSKFFKN